jgi:hypothetical protein
MPFLSCSEMVFGHQANDLVFTLAGHHKSCELAGFLFLLAGWVDCFEMLSHFWFQNVKT